MTRTSLVRTPAYWLMTALSGVSALLGTWLIVDKLPAMEQGLTDQTATTALVYGGQSWVVVGAALLGAGLLGLVLSLGVAAVRATGAADPIVVDEPVVVEAPVLVDPVVLVDADAAERPVDAEPEPVRG